MSPRFLGPHHQATCPGCGHEWKIAAETLGKNPEPIACSVCQQPCSLGDLQMGQTVIARILQPDQVLQRLDCVVFADEEQPELYNSAWACKRIWGRPGESIEFRHGELIVDGQMFRKGLLQMLQVAIPVACYPNYRIDLFSMPSGGMQSTNSPPSTASETSSGRLLELSSGQKLQWSQRTVDDYPENWSTPRNLAPVSDLLLEVEFESEVAGPGELKDSERPQESELHGSHFSANPPSLCLLLEMYYRGEQMSLHCLFGPEIPGPKANYSEGVAEEVHTFANPRRVYFGGWDGQMLCASDNETRTRCIKPVSIDLPLEDQDSSPTQFRLTALRGPIRIKKLTVARDIYLRVNERDPRNGSSQAFQMECDEYFVIGDNLPISIDSRNGLGSLQRKRIWAVIE